MKGVVVRKAGAHTVVIEVTAAFAYPLYGARKVRSRRYLVHDPYDKAQVGQEVEALSCRPLSARKRWMIVSYGAGT